MFRQQLIRHHHCRFHFSTKAKAIKLPPNTTEKVVLKGDNTTSTATKLASWKTWIREPKRLWNNRKLRKVVRVVRVVALCTVVGAGGVQYGQLKVAKDPESFDTNILNTLLLESGVEHVVVMDDNLSKKRAPYVYRKNPETMKYDQGFSAKKNNVMWVAATHSQRVFCRVKESAHTFVVALLTEVGRRRKASTSTVGKTIGEVVSDPSTTNNPPPFDWLNMDLDNMSDDDIQHWMIMERQLRSDWKIVMTDQLSPNAYVHAMLPRRVFVHLGLLNVFCKNDDQLAAVLGHELSHVLLRHTEHALILSVFQSVLAAAVVSMLDFTGLFGFMFELGAFSKIMKWSDAAFSREHETEADHLGEYLATMACYRPAAAVEVWQNATVFEKNMNGGQNLSAGMLDSHPLSTERAEYMEKDFLPVLIKLYADCECDKDVRNRDNVEFGIDLPLESGVVQQVD